MPPTRRTALLGSSAISAPCGASPAASGSNRAATGNSVLRRTDSETYFALYREKRTTELDLRAESLHAASDLRPAFPFSSLNAILTAEQLIVVHANAQPMHAYRRGHDRDHAVQPP
jgi:hypothetical protein